MVSDTIYCIRAENVWKYDCSLYAIYDVTQIQSVPPYESQNLKLEIYEFQDRNITLLTQTLYDVHHSF